MDLSISSVQQYIYFKSAMQNQQNGEFYLSIKTATWQKDSHSLFDYEFNKNVIQETLEFPLANKFIYIYRNNNNCQITCEESNDLQYKAIPNFQLLGCIQLVQDNKKHKLIFYNSTEVIAKNGGETARTSSSNEAKLKKDEDIYLIVRSLKNKNNENKGYKLRNGQILKLGRVEYLVTSAKCSQNPSENRAKFWTNTKRIVVEDYPELDMKKEECKYCYMGETQQPDSFLCSPCLCSGSCGLVHFRCLQKWNQSKVKKQAYGGTIQYNFQKFYCEVCKDQYPRYIEKNSIQYELLPIDKPQGDHIMLQGISQKANNMMVIQDIPKDGIKLGRGHDCQVRITDISVSRNHAKIEKIGKDYFAFDNKSKFGTLVKEERLQLELSRIKQGVQIGRTVITFEKAKKI